MSDPAVDRYADYLLGLWTVVFGFVAAFVPAASAQVAPGRIVFSAAPDGVRGLFSVRADGTELRRLTGDGDRDPTWSPDGCRLVVNRRGNRIVTLKGDGSDERLIVSIKGSNPEGDLRSHYSPDGLHILLDAHVEGYPRNGTFIVRSDGLELTDITRGRPAGTAVGWSPDGESILFDGIFVSRGDGSDLKRITEGDSPAWSPDGTRIAFSSRDEARYDIVVVNADGSGRRVIARGDPMNNRPVWSPDGSRIAFDALGDNGISLQVVDVDGSNLTILDHQLAFTMRPIPEFSWSPDGTSLVFTRQPVTWDGVGSGDEALRLMLATDLYLVAADGSGLTRVTTMGGAGYPVWSPATACEEGP